MAVSMAPNGSVSFIGGNKKGAQFVHTIKDRSREQLANENIRSFFFDSREVFDQLCLSLNESNMEDGHSNISDTNHAQVVSCGRSYCALLRTICEQLESCSSPDSPILQSYKCAEVIWTLAQALFIQPSGGILVVDLINWAKWNFTGADRLAREALDQLPNILQPNITDKYWNAVYLYILMGRHKDALEMLSVHPRKTENAFRSVMELIAKIPINKLGTNPMEFQMWQRECRRRVEEGHFTSFTQLNTIAKILGGYSEMYSETGDVFENWYEAIVPLILYSHPNTQLINLATIAEEAIDMIALKCDDSGVRPMDSIMVCLFELDVVQALSHMAACTGDWWLPSHLAHILQLSGVSDLGHQPSMTSFTNMSNLDDAHNNLTLTQFLLLQYAQFVTSDLSLWQLSMSYYVICDSGRQMLSNILLALPIKGDKMALKLVSECEKYGLVDVKQSICKTRTMFYLTRGHVPNALSWSFNTNDPLLATLVVEKCLDDEEALLEIYQRMHMLDNLTDVALQSPLLLFITKHRELTQLRSSGSVRKAANLLVDLVTSDLVPRKLWVTLFRNVLSMMLENCGNEILFDVQQSYELIEVVERMANEINVCNSKVFIGKMNVGEFDELLRNIRVALVRNLTNGL